jgi:maltose alpha-D-glucosyltransferase/alpha-amylase
LAALARNINPECILMGEVDVEPERFCHYFGKGQRLMLALDFWMNNHLFLALARQQSEPLLRALEERPLAPDGAGYAVWLRNHDELDLERLSEKEREKVMQVFAPQPEMRAYGRGIRRRLAPMLEGDVRHQAMAQALMASLPGTPIIRYGEEIGMGDDLTRKDRLAVRTPMQWSAEVNAGFSKAAPTLLPAPIIDDGPFAYTSLNVSAQQDDGESLLARCRSILRTRAELTEIGDGNAQPLRSGHPAVFAIRYVGRATSLMLCNLSSEPVTLESADWAELNTAESVLADSPYPVDVTEGEGLSIRGFGYRWFRYGHSKK